MKPQFTEKATKRLTAFYVKTRDKQGSKAKDVIDVHYKLMGTKDLIKLKNEAIKEAKKRGSDRVLVKDVNKAIQKARKGFLKF